MPLARYHQKKPNQRESASMSRVNEQKGGMKSRQASRIMTLGPWIFACIPRSGLVCRSCISLTTPGIVNFTTSHHHAVPANHDWHARSLRVPNGAFGVAVAPLRMSLTDPSDQAPTLNAFENGGSTYMGVQYPRPCRAYISSRSFQHLRLSGEPHLSWSL
jgi:hypothetical protein